MKMFFEEYGMVVVVMILAVSIITFSKNFAQDFGDSVSDKWEELISVDFSQAVE